MKDYTHARRSALVPQKLPTRPEEKMKQPTPGTSGGAAPSLERASIPIQPPLVPFLRKSTQQEADSVISPQLAAVSYMIQNWGAHLITPISRS
jgi:hypothetical protein